MTVRLYEGDKTETGGAGIEITDNKVVNLKLREENNLIVINEDDEAYVDLQLDSSVSLSDILPIGVNTGRVLEANGRPVNGTLTSSKTTSGDYTAYLYGDNGKIYVDNGSGVWRILAYEYEAGEGIEIIETTTPSYALMRGPCDEGFHVPTYNDANFLLRVAQGLQSQVPGAWIKAPSNGYIKFNNPTIYAAWTMWTCTSSGASTESAHLNAYLFNYDDSGEQHVQPLKPADKAYGCGVRGFADVPVVADGTWTTLGTTSRGTFYWKESLGLISVHSTETDKWITLQDKNVGATNVGDNGLYFQWGNNKGFTSASAATSSTRVDTSSYKPSTYYADPINTAYDWSEPSNPNLRGAVSGVRMLPTKTINNTGVLSVNGQTGDVTVDTTPIIPVGDTLPSSPAEGTIFFNTTDRKLNIYDGTDWNEIQATQVQ